MATGPRYKVAFRRRREARTDYYARRKLLTSHEARAVVRRSNKNITVQFVEFGMDGDKVLTTADGRNLTKYGWEHSLNNTPAAYLTGYAAGRKAVKAGIDYAVLDIGMQNPHYGECCLLLSRVCSMQDLRFLAVKMFCQMRTGLPESTWAKVMKLTSHR